MRARLLASIPCCLIISGCSFAPEYSRPVVHIPETFTREHDDGVSIANLSWWQVFHDEKLQALIKEALDNNRDLKKSVARIEEARAIVGFTRADQFPSLDITGGARRQDVGQGFPVNNSFSLLGNVSYEMDLWGKFQNATDAQRAELLSSTASYHTLQLSLVSQVAEFYFALIDIDQRIAIAKQTLKNRVDATTLIQQRLEKGIIPELDLNQAQIEQADVQASVYTLDRDMKRVEHALLVLLGRSMGVIERSKTLYNASLQQQMPAGIPANVLERRPDLMALEQQIQKSLFLEGVTEAQRLPSIDILGTLGLGSADSTEFFSQDARSWSIGGGLFSPLLSWNRNIARVEAQEARTKQAKFEYENAVLKAMQEVSDALVEIKTFHAEYKSRSVQVKAAENARKLSRARYNDGVVTYVEVLDIERSLYTAQLRESLAYRSYLTSLVRLYKALGGGWNAA